MILHVFKSNIYSGAENVACQIINGLSDREEFVYMAPHGPIEDKLKSIELINCYRGIDKLSISEIKKAVDELKPSVVHAHDFTASVLCGLALKGKVPVISHIHCNPLWLSKKLHPNTISYLLASRYFNHIIAVSDAVTREYCYSNSLKCPVTVLGNPFSVEQVVSAAGDGCTDGASSDKNLACDLLYVGRFNPAKNPLGAIKIFEALPNHSQLLFRMVGDGELLSECRDYVANHGLSDNVVFEGFQEKVYKYMAAAKVILMPSIFEGFGLVALESMSLGKPVVCSGVGGLADIVEDSCGYICKDEKAYTEALTTLLTDSSIYTQKSEAARLRARSFDNITDYCDKLYEIYESTVIV